MPRAVHARFGVAAAGSSRCASSEGVTNPDCSNSSRYNTIRVFIFKLYSFPKLAFSRGIGGASCASVGHSVGGREGLLRAVPARCATMVFHFQVRGGYTVYMGRDKYENEKLIKWGWPEDVWFHVDDMSSAHVYLRMKEVGRPCGLTAACISLLMHGWSPLMICHGACGT